MDTRRQRVTASADMFVVQFPFRLVHLSNRSSKMSRWGNWPTLALLTHEHPLSFCSSRPQRTAADHLVCGGGGLPRVSLGFSSGVCSGGGGKHPQGVFLSVFGPVGGGRALYSFHA